MRDIKITIPAGETSRQQAPLRAWLVRSVDADDAVKLVTNEQGSLLLHAGQQVELDAPVDGFELINESAAPVVLHLQIAGRASIGSKKNGGESGGVDQVARDAAAANAEAVAENAAAIDAAADTQPFAQALKDSGRLIVGQDEGERSFAAAFDNRSCYLRSQTTQHLESQKYAYNNGSHGGSGPVLGVETNALLAKMGRVGSYARYGSDFFVSINKMLPGPLGYGYQVAGEVYHLAVASQLTTGMDGYLTMCYWLYSEIGGQMAVKNVAGLRVGGAEISGDYQAVAGWQHVQVLFQDSRGYVNSTFSLYGKPDAKFGLALPVYSRSRSVLPVHTAPIIYT